MSTETPGSHGGGSQEEKAEVGGAGKSPSTEQITEEERSWSRTDLKTLGASKSSSRDEEEDEDKGNSGATTPIIAGAAESYRKYEISCSSSSSQRKGSAGAGGPGGDGEAELEDYSEDDTEVSSEAVVDDIELILMPEEVEDLPAMENAPKLVRVTELSTVEYTDEFLKMDDTDMRELDEEEYEEDENEYDDGAERDFDEEGDDEWTENNGKRSGGGRSFDKVHSGVQTDITALDKDGGEDEDDSCVSEGHSSRLDLRRRKTMTLTGVGLGGTRLSGRGGGRVGGSKKLNWKSELTLLPSKTKIGFPCSTGQSMDGSAMGFGAFSYASTSYSIDSNYPPDQYSSRVAKFTSQENMTSSGSQFLKPSTLYRTRNLSRNLNHFASSETTFMQDQPDSPRFQASNSALSSAANFKGSTSVSSNQICMTTANVGSSVRRRASAKNFRQSLPDLTSPVYSQQDNKRRQTLSSGRSGKVHHGQQTYSSGYRMQKRSSSDDETSSLIDESERCLRSSIDLLLTDDYPSPGYDYPYLPRSSGGGGGRPGQKYTSGYYSARRSCSQPLLTDEGLVGEPRDSSMGSPFLPRTLKDMRCSRWAKVILPNGLVAVVCVKEMDEVRDCLTVHTETGCVLTIPFRKVVFAWRVKR